MKAEVVYSGLIGLVVGGILYALAAWFKNYLPALISDRLATIGVFAILAMLAVAEMPMMVFAMRRMTRSSGDVRGLVMLTNIGYVAFAAVYAMIHVLVTGDNYFWFGNILAALCLVRFATGVFIK